MENTEGQITQHEKNTHFTRVNRAFVLIAAYDYLYGCSRIPVSLYTVIWRPTIIIPCAFAYLRYWILFKKNQVHIKFLDFQDNIILFFIVWKSHTVATQVKKCKFAPNAEFYSEFWDKGKNTKYQKLIYQEEIPKCTISYFKFQIFFLNARHLMLEDNSSNIMWTLAYSTASIYSRTGNKCLPEITVIGSLNASGKPFEMWFVFCTTANKQEFTHWNTQTTNACSSLSQL